MGKRMFVVCRPLHWLLTLVHSLAGKRPSLLASCASRRHPVPCQARSESSKLRWTYSLFQTLNANLRVYNLHPELAKQVFALMIFFGLVNSKSGLSEPEHCWTDFCFSVWHCNHSSHTHLILSISYPLFHPIFFIWERVREMAIPQHSLFLLRVPHLGRNNIT